FIEARRAMPRRDLHAAFVEAYGREDVSLDNFKGLCKRKGWLTGRTGRYEKGDVPANKGKRMPYHPNSARTRFKKGQLPHNTKYAGHERVRKDGYVEISVNERNPHTGADRRYVHKHRWLWEQKNGPVPEDMVLKCLDGDKTNTDPSNWKLIPRGMLPRLNGVHGRGYDDAPADLKPTIMAVSELEHRAREGNAAKK
ncbi:MAG TPA: HNH endonuclease, partial [Rhodospirillaceae bacterium]|nr:HNH endonuclease [Rhodospirillaceae bacterium]